MLAKILKQFYADECGAVAIEYGLIAGLMAVASIFAFATMSNGLQNLFGATNDGAGNAISSAAASADLN